MSAVVYYLYGADGSLLYIGSTNNLTRRCDHHRHNTPWWSEVTQVINTPCASLDAARAVEVAAIHDEAPRYNKLHNRPRIPIRPTEFDRDVIGSTEAAEMLGCSVWTVHRRIRNGELWGEKIGKGWIVRRCDVLLLAERAA